MGDSQGLWLSPDLRGYARHLSVMGTVKAFGSDGSNRQVDSVSVVGILLDQTGV